MILLYAYSDMLRDRRCCSLIIYFTFIPHKINIDKNFLLLNLYFISLFNVSQNRTKKIIEMRIEHEKYEKKESEKSQNLLKIFILMFKYKAVCPCT